MALIKKLKNIANAIRSKTNKSEELTLEQMASEVEGIDTLQGLDFSGVFDQEQANEINQYHKDGIEYAKSIIQKYQGIKIKDLARAFQYDNKLVYMPNIDLSETKTLFFTWHTCVNLEYIEGRLNSGNVNDMYAMFYRCYKLQEVDIDTSSVTRLQQAFYESSNLTKIVLSSVEKCTNFSSAFYMTYSLVYIKFEKWKQGDVSLSYSVISPESIHYIIQNAVNLADGATARTLTLHATAKTNWQNSEYYEQDLAVLEQKGITIA